MSAVAATRIRAPLGNRRPRTSKESPDTGFARPGRLRPGGAASHCREQNPAILGVNLKRPEEVRNEIE